MYIVYVPSDDMCGLVRWPWQGQLLQHNRRLGLLQLDVHLSHLPQGAPPCWCSNNEVRSVSTERGISVGASPVPLGGPSLRLYALLRR